MAMMLTGAIQATAAPVAATEPLAQGAGLIQVAKAFEALRGHPSPGIHFEVPYRVSVSGENCRADAAT